jgi:hypothetical protein
MIKITEFDPAFSALLPETEKLLRATGFFVHPRVAQVALHGSRGPAGGCHPDSDIDLSLLVHTLPLSVGPELDRLLRAVLETTLENWEGEIEPDLMAVFEIRECGLECFCAGAPNDRLCQKEGTDCFGLYKIQRGFNGFVSRRDPRIKRTHPCLVIWRHPTDELSAA